MESYIMGPGAHTAVWSRNSVGRAATLSAHAPMKTSNTDLLIATAPNCLFPFEDGQSLVAPAHAVCRATNHTHVYCRRDGDQTSAQRPVTPVR